MVGISTTAATADDDELYREIILDHYRHPRHKGEVAEASARVEASNPLCGDEVTLSWRLVDGRLTEIGFGGRGCSICMASTSMLCEALTGTSGSTAIATAQSFKEMLLDRGPCDQLGDLAALQGVANYPVRIKCAVLAWNALLQELDSSESQVYGPTASV